ncbi:MAG: c-type cytochrome domain-containing protein [Gemmataceae bacterium]
MRLLPRRKAQRGGLRLDSRAATLKGGDGGPAVVPGQPDKSPLVRAVRRVDETKMPPKDKDALPPAAVDALVRWVQSGAPWPGGDATAVAVSPIAERGSRTGRSGRSLTRRCPP